MSDTFETLSTKTLDQVSGGFSKSDMPSSAQWIMQHESGGNTHATNPTSTAYGAFQMLKATRKQYMGANWQSSDLGQQYAGATKYVDSRYGGWNQAQSFWQSHKWY